MKRVLVVRNDKIGDLVLATPLLDALKAKGCFVGVLASPYAAPILETDPAVDALIVDPKQIKAHGFDTALLLWGNWRNAMHAWNAAIPERIGISGRLFSMLLTKRLNIRRSEAAKGEVEYNLDFLGEPAAVTAPRLHLSDKDRELAKAWLRAKALAKPVMLHPGSRGSAQNWEPKRYAELGLALKERTQSPLLVTAGPGEQELAAEVADACGAAVLDELLPLRAFAALCGEASLFVSASTGPMHLAAALGAPTLSLFPPLRAMSPRRWGPRGNQHAVLSPAGLGWMAPASGINYVSRISVAEAAEAAGFLLKDMNA